MRKVTLVLSSAVFSVIFFCAATQARENSIFNLAGGNAAREFQLSFSKPTVGTAAPSSQIKDIQVFGEQWGIAFTRDTLFRTDDNGVTWREIALPKSSLEIINAVSFLSENQYYSRGGQGLFGVVTILSDLLCNLIALK